MTDQPTVITVPAPPARTIVIGVSPMFAVKLLLEKLTVPPKSLSSIVKNWEKFRPS